MAKELRAHLDLETYSELDLKVVGVHVYAAHPSTEILCASYAVGSGDVVTLPYGQSLVPMLTLFRKLGIVAAHNAQFERVVLETLFPMIKAWKLRWVCTAAKAAMHSLNRKLEKCTVELKVREHKDMAGNKVMLKLSKPKRATKADPTTRYLPTTHPREFQKLYLYNAQDVRAERAIDDRLPDLPKREQVVYELDQAINDRGVMVDRQLVTDVIKAWNLHLEDVNARCRKLTGVSATQVGELTKWLGMEELTKGSIEAALQDPALIPAKREVLLLRQEGAKTSVRKFTRMAKAMGPDDRLRGMFLYFAANTGRWGGRIVQLHNLPRNTAKNPEEVIAAIRQGGITGDSAQQLIRPSLVAAPGKELVVGDFSGIEYRITMWLANCIPALHIIRNGQDLYKATASAIYRVGYDEVTDDQRFTGKQAILGLGFGMGVNRFIDQCAGYGVEISQELGELTVKTYRRRYKEVVETWYELERAAIAAMRGKENRAFPACRGLVKYFKRADFLYCKFPSGRVMAYPFPKVVKDTNPFGEAIDVLTYLGMNNHTRQRERITTWGGKLMENCAQGIARDMLADAMLRLEQQGVPIVLQVHDEIGAEVVKGTNLDFAGLMAIVPEWAEGLPVEVKAFTTQRYRK